MTPADLATLSLLDPDQGVCPAGHPCVLDDRAIGRRRCGNGAYVGLALICWHVTVEAIDQAAMAGANPRIVDWTRAFVEDRTR